FRELDDALLHLRFNHPTIGVVVVRTRGDGQAVLAHDDAIGNMSAAGDWLAREVLGLQKRVLKRYDQTSRTFFALIDPGSCFAGTLLELALGADRVYMKSGGHLPPSIILGRVNDGPLPMANGLTRLRARLYGVPQKAAVALEKQGQRFHADAALA